MRRDKGWLQTQMQSAKSEVNGWQSWKKDTLRREISSGLAQHGRGESVTVRSGTTGRFVVAERKK